MNHSALRAAVVRAGRALIARGLTTGTSGNLSVRVSGGFLVSPTGIPYDRMKPGDVVLLDAAGVPAPRQAAPSSEWRIHRDLYHARADIGAVVHAHPPMATTVACLREPIPAVHYMVAAAGGDTVPCAPYATFGTPELSAATISALGSGWACLLANHGLVAAGPDLARALAVANEVEVLAGLYVRLRPLGGGVVLTGVEMEQVRRRFAHYGQPPGRGRRR